MTRLYQSCRTGPVQARYRPRCRPGADDAKVITLDCYRRPINLATCEFWFMNNDIDRETILANLNRLPWAKGIGEEAVEEIADASEVLQIADGEWVHHAGDTLSDVYFVIRGRVWATVVDLFGKTVLERPLVRGDCFGLFSVAQPENAAVNVKAMEPTWLLKLDFEDLHRLTAKYREFQMSVYRLAGKQVRQIMAVDRHREQPSVVGIVHHSAASRPLMRRLVERLSEIKEAPCVASDNLDWEPIAGVAFRSLIEDGRVIDQEVARRQLKEWSEMGRIFVDVSADRSLDELARTMSFVETVLWCVRPVDAEKAQSILQQLQDRVPGWRDKICLVWLLDSQRYIAPLVPELTSLVARTFKLSLDQPVPNQGSLLHVGLERIVHHLRGVRIGIALGGGAARGMAHLGVLKALENNGIYVDMIAGTSAGAMTGILYAYGMSPEYAVECFKNDLRLPWLFRKTSPAAVIGTCCISIGEVNLIRCSDVIWVMPSSINLPSPPTP